jgi:trehalose 6-phosphate phosphatase
LVHALERVDDWRRARARQGRMLLALDFDGTLAPITSRPDAVALPGPARSAIERLLGRHDTDVAVVSGRGLADVRARVGIDGIYYAGNHGMEIEGPDVSERHAAAEALRPALAECIERLAPLVRTQDGLVFEDKGFTLSVHYRLVPESEQAEVRARIERACAGVDGVRVMHGKKIVEVRPDVDWHKGRATRFLLDTLEAAHARVGAALFIGDDVTDEDAFRSLLGRGDGILVADPPPADTAATAYLRTPEEVALLLDALTAD